MLSTKSVIIWSAPENEAVLTKMVDDGMKVADIADAIGISKSCVNTRLKEHWPEIYRRVVSCYKRRNYVKIIEALKIAKNKSELAEMADIKPCSLRRFLIDNYPQYVEKFYNTRRLSNIRMLKGALGVGKINVIAEKLDIPESSVITGRRKYGHLSAEQKKAELSKLEGMK